MSVSVKEQSPPLPLHIHLLSATQLSSSPTRISQQSPLDFTMTNLGGLCISLAQSWMYFSMWW